MPRGSSSSAPTRKRRQGEASSPPPRRRPTCALNVGRSRHANEASDRTPGAVCVSVPSWPEPAKLPYHVLLAIFQYAAYPLQAEAGRASSHALWLTRIARLRRDFVEPALSALYYDPPLESVERAYRLLRALQTQKEDSIIDYRRKVRHLEVDAQLLLIYKYGGQDPIHLNQFLELTPMLRRLRINLPNDDPLSTFIEARIPSGKIATWYGEQTFELLDSVGIVLDEWKWNFAFETQLHYPWTQMYKIHQSTSFQKLRRLELCRIRNPKESMVTMLSAALGELSCLDSLFLTHPILRSDEHFLVLFRHLRPLQTLKIDRCDQLDSDLLAQVLVVQGSRLQSLILNHNRALDLGCLGNLQTLCPQLQMIAMDLTFAHGVMIVHGNKPSFETLLPMNCTPMWPQKLRSISLNHLRKWDTDAATRFLQSLIDAAPEMCDLRRLEIRMSVDADWKDRISFRDKWETRITKTFLQELDEPNRWYRDTQPASAQRTEQPKLRNTASAKTRRPQILGAMSQGRGHCEYVDIRIDNLRPMERQFDESNFLDEESSGDEDYVE